MDESKKRPAINRLGINAGLFYFSHAQWILCDMDIGQMTGQISKWALKAGASLERADNYAGRAAVACGAIREVAESFKNGINQDGGQSRFCVDCDAVTNAVLGYNRELLAFKGKHGFPADARIDTYICAGLWFCQLVREPVFGCEDSGGRLDMAEAGPIRDFYGLLARFAFYFAFRVLRGHYKKFQEMTLYRLLVNLREYICNHREEIAGSQAASVGIFLTISLFDREIAGAPIEPILS